MLASMWEYRCSRADRLFVARYRFVDGALHVETRTTIRSERKTASMASMPIEPSRSSLRGGLVSI